jgi:protein O-mannosyl-transferase
LSLNSATAVALEKPPSSHKPGGVFVSQQKRSTVLSLLLVLFTLAFYNPVVHNGFINMDDNGYVTDNSHVQAGLTWATVKWAFTTLDDANWHPITWLSHALDYQLFKMNPAGHHYVTVLLHGTNAILLFLLLEGATGLTWPSFVVAALFTLHPINVESVAWAAERKNVLSLLFLLLAMHAYQRYVRHTRFWRYAVVAFLFALGLMAKPEIITFPFVLLLWDYWPLRRLGSLPSTDSPPIALTRQSFSYLFLEKVPLLLLSAGSSIVTLIAQRRGEAVRTASTRIRFGNAGVGYVRYLGKAVWPSRLAALYPHLGRLLPTWQIVGSAALLLLLTVFVLRFRKHRYLAVGWFWFLGTLVPMIGLVQVGVQAIADRYAYLSFIGLFICAVWGISEIARDQRLSSKWLAVPAILILGTFGVLTSRQVTYWHDSVSLWQHTLSVTQMNYFAHNALGEALVQQGDTAGAIREFDAAESLHTYTASDLARIAAYKAAHGHVKEAVAEYDRALDAASDSKTRSNVLTGLLSLFLQVHDQSNAKLACTYAIKENANNGSALVGCGLLAEQQGNYAAAADQIAQAMKLEPTDVGYLLLAQAWRAVGESAKAADATAQAQRISRDIDKAQRSAAEVLATAGIHAEPDAALNIPFTDSTGVR